MRYFLSSLIFFIISFNTLLLHANAIAAGFQDNEKASKVFKAIAPSVATITTVQGGGRQGSGVVIKAFEGQVARSYLITNAHVVGNADVVKVSIGSQQFEAAVDGIDAELDLALISISGVRLPFIRIKHVRDNDVGSTVFAIGTPLGLERTITAGLISGIRKDGVRELIQTSAPISSGSSGGGLFSNDGELLGITAQRTTQGEGLGFAISAAHIEPFFDAVYAQGILRWFVQSDLAKAFGLEPSVIEVVTRSKGLPKALREISINNQPGYRYVEAMKDDLKNALLKQGVNPLESNGFKELTRISRAYAKASKSGVTGADYLLLLCKITTPSGKEDSLDLEIDLAGGTVNGKTALITDRSISFEFAKDSEAVINRASGLLTIVASTFRVTGRCTPSQGRAF